GAGGGVVAGWGARGGGSRRAGPGAPGRWWAAGQSGYIAGAPRSPAADPGPRLAGWFRWRPVAGQLVQPPDVGGRVGLAVLLEDPVDVLGDQRGNHVHDVVPVITAPREPLHRLPC